MRIIAPIGQINTEKDVCVLMFQSEDELNNLLSRLAQIKVRTSGIRIITLTPDNLNEKQKSILDIIQGLDGITGSEHEEITNNAIDSIKKLL